ncbi:MAG: DUF4147 domain-containing protein [Gammaproteobacteria bacterium]|mgnify:CR=1 FL=1|nr:DUF4147 domain-containing protein [Gammaproteobacteria bacterium]
MRMTGPRDDLLAIFAAALAAVNGEAAVVRALADTPLAGRWRVVAVGKAAAAMWRGARQSLGERLAAGLVITKSGHAEGLTTGPGIEVIESDHPVPGAQSLAAGRRLLAFLGDAPPDARFLFLISGGASSLVEVLPEGLDAGWLARLNTWLLGSGLEIAAVNAVRRRASRIKGGGLLSWLAGREACCLLISDVPGDDPAVIGSGLLVPGGPSPLPECLPDWIRDGLPPPRRPDAASPVDCRIVADRRRALAAAATEAAARGYPVYRHETFLAGEAQAVGGRLAETLRQGPAGVHLWAGETTVRLPARPGRGGRNQHLALAAAQRLAGEAGIWLLAVGTDGSDGPTGDAGALVDGQSMARMMLDGCDPVAALAGADAGPCLEAAGDLIRTGPTGTNVMDLVIGLKIDGPTPPRATP